MTTNVQTGTVRGVDGVPVQVEVDLVNRLPCMVIVGLPDRAVKESVDRVRSAVTHLTTAFPRRRVVINLAPANIPKRGTGFDLPIAVGILVAQTGKNNPLLAGTVFLGELSLEGQLRPVRGALPIALMAAKTGAKRIVVPLENASEASMVKDIEVLGARDLDAVRSWLDGKSLLPSRHDTILSPPARTSDLSEVCGQARARRALEIAAAGGHNLLLMGAPGCGKTMLAARMASILPPLSFTEAVDVTRIHSVAGQLNEGVGLLAERPFRMPHHSITTAGMVGTAALRPGEVSLAHNGVLFLDEFPEFRRNVLELLRGPLEDRQITLTRASGSVRLPAAFTLVAAANPCPCGYLGHRERPCSCLPSSVDRYRNRLSGPLLDRIDLQVWVQPVPVSELTAHKRGESSERVRARVQSARALQTARYREAGIRCNAELSGNAIRTATRVSARAEQALADTVSRNHLSARAWARIIKVSRTIADLADSQQITPEHILEASSYRVLQTLDAATA